ncbi:MAG TPA: HEAT repeat domain-containing protein [Candidatus Saccharimonadales bacterium]|jgi:HEAT repeat protein|nr:HEAT repeat domain-containing protein [Candidatus Saccharimonadales bacterium]
MSAIYLGMLANRGVETDHIHGLLKKWAHEADEQTRFWAVEGLAYFGTDDTIQDFLDVLRNDPSLNVRERAGCSLAKSGMLTREQRLKAVPGLIEIGADPAVDATTRNWAFQALREITGEGISNDPSAWRNWLSSHGAERAEEFRRDQNRLLGNN